MYQIWRMYLDLWGHDCKNWVWTTFSCKIGQSDPIVTKLKLNMPYHLLNVYTKFQIDISLHVEFFFGKLRWTDGQTDERMDGHCHSKIQPFFKQAFKNGGTNNPYLKLAEGFYVAHFYRLIWNTNNHINNTKDTTIIRLLNDPIVLCMLSPTLNQQRSRWYPHMQTVHPDWWNHSHQMLLGQPVLQTNELDCLLFLTGHTTKILFCLISWETHKSMTSWYHPYHIIVSIVLLLS